MEDILGLILYQICADTDYKVARKAVCSIKCICKAYYKIAGKLGYYSKIKTEPKQILKYFYATGKKHGLNTRYRINDRGFKVNLTLYDKGVVIRNTHPAHSNKRNTKATIQKDEIQKNM